MTRAKKRPPQTPDIAPTPERMAKSGGYFHVGQTHEGGKMVTLRDAPLERLEASDVIDGRQYSAASKFRHHWRAAGLQERFSAVKYDGMPWASSLGGMPEGEWAAHHQQQYRNAVGLLGVRRSLVVEQIACREVNPVDVGRSLGWANAPQARAAAVTMLRDALDVLADLWGLS